MLVFSIRLVALPLAWGSLRAKGNSLQNPDHGALASESLNSALLSIPLHFTLPASFFGSAITAALGHIGSECPGNKKGAESRKGHR